MSQGSLTINSCPGYRANIALHAINHHTRSPSTVLILETDTNSGERCICRFSPPAPPLQCVKSLQKICHDQPSQKFTRISKIDLAAPVFFDLAPPRALQGGLGNWGLNGLAKLNTKKKQIAPFFRYFEQSKYKFEFCQSDSPQKITVFVKKTQHTIKLTVATTRSHPCRALAWTWLA